MRRIIVMMMMVLIMLELVVVQADDPPPSLPPPPPSHESDRRCAGICAVKCFFKKRKNRRQYLLCFDLCMLKCRISLPDVLYNCTFGCSQSMSTNFGSGKYKPKKKKKILLPVFMIYKTTKFTYLQVSFYYHSVLYLTDADKVEAYVETCYNNCKKNY